MVFFREAIPLRGRRDVRFGGGVATRMIPAAYSVLRGYFPPLGTGIVRNLKMSVAVFYNSLQAMDLRLVTRSGNNSLAS